MLNHIFLLAYLITSTSFAQELVIYQYEKKSNDTSQFLSYNDTLDNESMSLLSEQESIMYNSLRTVFLSVKFWRDIYIVSGIIITIIGPTLNFLCIFIFSKSKLFRNSSFPYYVYVISIIDTLNIFMRYLVPQSMETYIRSVLESRFNISHYVHQENYDKYTNEISSEYHCSVFYYLYNCLTLMSVWLMAAVSLERWLVIKYTLQTRKMIKMRAITILLCMFITIFCVNIFDLAPGFYTKPQWYANLTILCERQDKLSTSDNYKTLGPIRFNTEIFAFTRMLFQSVFPFLVVLIFNSFIIYNFKKIKSTALGHSGRAKSNSCVSVNSGISNDKNNTSHNRTTFRSSHHKRFKNNLRHQNDQQCKFTNSSRSPSLSPSPMHNYSAPNTPVTPTSLVSALNLAEGNLPTSSSPTTIVSPTAPTTPTIGFNHQNVENERKQLSNSFLMPPTFSSIQPRSSEHTLNNDSATPSIGTTNSSANLSVATTSNLTTTTMLNHNHIHNQQRKGSSIVSGTESARMITSLKSSPTLKHNKAVSTVTKTTTGARVSFKSRISKVRLNRETDIMLIVLSFSILLSQLPFTIVWYLVYYQLIFLEIDNNYWTANSPKVFYIIRILEMIYFSLNFFFYITLSPSLRKEIKNNLSKKVVNEFFNKYILNKSLMKSHLSKRSINENELSGIIVGTMQNGKCNNNEIVVDCEKVKNSSKKKLKHGDYDNQIMLQNEKEKSSCKLNKRLYSNSSGEYMEYLDKLRSISPIRRPAFLMKPTREFLIIKPTSQKDIKKPKKPKKIFGKKEKSNSSSSTKNSSSKPLVKNSNIKIVIDNLYDEEELKLDNEFIVAKFELEQGNQCLVNGNLDEFPSNINEIKNAKQYDNDNNINNSDTNSNYNDNNNKHEFLDSASPSFYLDNSFDLLKTNVKLKNNTNDYSEADDDDDHNAHRIAYL